MIFKVYSELTVTFLFNQSTQSHLFENQSIIKSIYYQNVYLSFTIDVSYRGPNIQIMI